MKTQYENPKLDDVYSKGNKTYKVSELNEDTLYAYDEKGNLHQFDRTEFKVLFKKEYNTKNYDVSQSGNIYSVRDKNNVIVYNTQSESDAKIVRDKYNNRVKEK